MAKHGRMKGEGKELRGEQGKEDVSGWRNYWAPPGLTPEERQSLDAAARRMELEGRLKTLPQSDDIYRQAAARHGKPFQEQLEKILPAIREFDGLRKEVNGKITTVDNLISELGALLDAGTAEKVNNQLDGYDKLKSEIKKELEGESLAEAIDSGEPKMLVRFAKKIEECTGKTKQMLVIAEAVHEMVSKKH